jgi:hypothetical protein
LYLNGLNMMIWKWWNFFLYKISFDVQVGQALYWWQNCIIQQINCSIVVWFGFYIVIHFDFLLWRLMSPITNDYAGAFVDVIKSQINLQLELRIVRKSWLNRFSFFSLHYIVPLRINPYLLLRLPWTQHDSLFIIN